MQKDIIELEDQLQNEQNEFNKNVALKLIDLYSSYAENFPEDTISARYLFDAARLSRGLNNYVQSVSLFKKVYDNYSDFNDRPVALFLMALVSEEMKQYESASSYYKKFLSEFPEHNLHNDAEFSLKFMGLSDDELLDAITKQNQNTGIQ